jgi:thiosulfate dehydrogenase [quinone] large subunit
LDWKNHFITRIIWTAMRIYVGWQWLSSGIGKTFGPNSSVWVGSKAGAAVNGFLTGALQKTTGEHPDVQWWYAYFIQHAALPNAKLFSYAVAWGEVLVGIALIAGLLTTVALLAGVMMNLNYLLAGTVSINPVLLTLEAILLWAGPAAYNWGLDRLIWRRQRGRIKPRLS